MNGLWAKKSFLFYGVEVRCFHKKGRVVLKKFEKKFEKKGRLVIVIWGLS